MKPLLIIISSGGAAAGYAAKELVAQSGKGAALAIIPAENALPCERAPLAKAFLAGQVDASGLQI